MKNKNHNKHLPIGVAEEIRGITKRPVRGKTGKRAILLLLSCLCSASAGTLAEYLEQAAKNHPGLRSAHQEWQAQVSRAEAADALPDPTFNLGYQFEQIETRVGPQEYKAGISQMIPWFGKRALMKEAADAGASGKYNRWKADALAVFFEVKSAYHEYAYLKQAIDLVEENMELTKHLEQVAQARVRAGGATSASIQAQVELGKLDDRIRSLKDMRKPLVARLNAAMNQAVQVELPWPSDVPAHFPRELDANALRSAAEANPMIMAIDSRMNRSAAQVQLARKAQYPDIMFGIDYIQTDEALNTNLEDSGKDPVIGMIGFNLPIWPTKNRARIAEARAQQEAAAAAREAQVNTLHKNLQMALYTYEDAARKLRLYRDTLIPQADQSLQISEQTYKAGKVDFINLIDAERMLLMFQLGEERAKADLEIGRARIEMITAQEWEDE